MCVCVCVKQTNYTSVSCVCVCGDKTSGQGSVSNIFGNKSNCRNKKKNPKKQYGHGNLLKKTYNEYTCNKNTRHASVY